MLVQIVFAVSVLILVLICVWIGYCIFKWPAPRPFQISHRMRVMGLVGFIAIIALTSIKFDKPFYYFPGLSGRVVDMDTGLPIKDAVVVVDVQETVYGNPAGPAHGDIVYEELVTGADGWYRIKPGLKARLWPFATLWDVEIKAMHILTAKTSKSLRPIRITPRTEDIKLMSERKMLLTKGALPASVDVLRQDDHKALVRGLYSAGRSRAVIEQYYSERSAILDSVLGKDPSKSVIRKPEESWFH